MTASTAWAVLWSAEHKHVRSTVLYCRRYEVVPAGCCRRRSTRWRGRGTSDAWVRRLLALVEHAGDALGFRQPSAKSVEDVSEFVPGVRLVLEMRVSGEGAGRVFASLAWTWPNGLSATCVQSRTTTQCGGDGPSIVLGPFYTLLRPALALLGCAHLVHLSPDLRRSRQQDSTCFVSCRPGLL